MIMISIMMMIISILFCSNEKLKGNIVTENIYFLVLGFNWENGIRS